MPEHRPFRTHVAGVTAKSSAGDDAEAAQAQGLAHNWHQAVKFQPGSVRIFFEPHPHPLPETEGHWMFGGLSANTHAIVVYGLELFYHVTGNWHQNATPLETPESPSLRVQGK